MSQSNPLTSIQLPLDFEFLKRVYRTSAVLTVLGTVFIWEAKKAPSALAWALGATLSLLGLWATELTIKRFIQPGSQDMTSMVWVSLGKLLVMIAVVVGAFWATSRGYLNLPWALPGFMLPHLVIVLKLAGRKLSSVMRTQPKPEPPGG